MFRLRKSGEQWLFHFIRKWIADKSGNRTPSAMGELLFWWARLLHRRPVVVELAVAFSAYNLNIIQRVQANLLRFDVAHVITIIGHLVVSNPMREASALPASAFISVIAIPSEPV